MKKNKKQTAYNWIVQNVGLKPFENDDDTAEEFAEFFAGEMQMFADEFAPKTPMLKWIKRHYTAETFFEDHEKLADKYYEPCYWIKGDKL